MKNILRTDIAGIIVTTSHEPATGFHRTQVIGGALDGEYRVALTAGSAEMNHAVMCERVRRTKGVR